MLFIHLFLMVLFSVSSLLADEGNCNKCRILNQYHQDHPSKYEYYDDYLKDLEEKGADQVNPNPKDLPDDVKFIMYPEQKKNNEKK